jgi:hypothetical protein
MLRFLIGSLLCIFLANCLIANAASIEQSQEAVGANNSSLAHGRQKRCNSILIYSLIHLIILEF